MWNKHGRCSNLADCMNLPYFTKKPTAISAPSYFDGFSHTDKYNMGGIVYCIFPGVIGRDFQISMYFYFSRLYLS